MGKGDHVVVDEVHQGKPLFMYIAGTLGSTSSEPFGPKPICHRHIDTPKGEGIIVAFFTAPHSYFKSSVSVSIIFLTSTGFAMWAFIPTDKAFSTSSLKAFAVIATMGIFDFTGSAMTRISRVA